MEDQEGGNKSDVSPKGNDSPHQRNSDEPSSSDESSTSDDSYKGSLCQQGQDKSLPGMKGENTNGKRDEKDSNQPTNDESSKGEKVSGQYGSNKEYENNVMNETNINKYPKVRSYRKMQLKVKPIILMRTHKMIHQWEALLDPKVVLENNW